MVLSYAARRSQHKYQIRILLINIYRLLGASSVALKHYRALGVKQIQNDTLSHLIAERGSTFAIDSDLDGIVPQIQTASAWYSTGIAEAREMPVKAFNLERYNKVRSNPSLVLSKLILESTGRGVYRFQDSLGAVVTADSTAARMAEETIPARRDHRDRTSTSRRRSIRSRQSGSRWASSSSAV